MGSFKAKSWYKNYSKGLTSILLRLNAQKLYLTVMVTSEQLPVG